MEATLPKFQGNCNQEFIKNFRKNPRQNTLYVTLSARNHITDPSFSVTALQRLKAKELRILNHYFKSDFFFFSKIFQKLVEQKNFPLEVIEFPDCFSSAILTLKTCTSLTKKNLIQIENKFVHDLREINLDLKNPDLQKMITAFYQTFFSHPSISSCSFTTIELLFRSSLDHDLECCFLRGAGNLTSEFEISYDLILVFLKASTQYLAGSRMTEDRYCDFLWVLLDLLNSYSLNLKGLMQLDSLIYSHLSKENVSKYTDSFSLLILTHLDPSQFIHFLIEAGKTSSSHKLLSFLKHPNFENLSFQDLQNLEATFISNSFMRKSKHSVTEFYEILINRTVQHQFPETFKNHLLNNKKTLLNTISENYKKTHHSPKNIL